jgi:hypothetical protein
MDPQDLAKLIDAVKAEVRRAMSPWMTEAEAAEYLGVSPTTIRANRAALRPGRIGKRWKYRRENLDRAIKSPWM